jgi:hypothetical protein
VNALATLSTFYEDNTAQARSKLRSNVEKRGLDIHSSFLAAASDAIRALDAVQGHLDALSSSCRKISNVLATTKAATAPLLSDVDRFQKELDHVDQRSIMIDDFLKQYQLSPEEVDVLQSGEVGPKFFAALTRVRQIHENCKSLLRTHHQRAGLELMDLMSTYQESAYECLCRWVQGECRNIGGKRFLCSIEPQFSQRKLISSLLIPEADAPEVDGALRAAVGALKERPVLFKYCSEEVATARHNALFQRFITALTRGGPGGVPRPIEIHAHDPKRYINDMLAWVHQALAGEKEFVVALFGSDEAAKALGSGRSTSPDASKEDVMSSTALLDKIFESICRPLKVRIEQVIMSSPPLLLCYQLSQLHSFYLGLVERVVGAQAGLSLVLKSSRDMATRVFHEQLKGRGDKLIRSPPVPPKDLSPPSQVQEALSQLLDILSAHESALESSPFQPSSSDVESEELGLVLSSILDPLVEACEKSCEAFSPVDAPADASAREVYMINCLSAMASALGSKKGYYLSRAQKLSDAIESHISGLVGGEVSKILSKCALSEVLDRMWHYKQPATGAAQGGPASDPTLSIQRISEVMRAFFILVSSPDALPEFRAILAPRTRAEAVARVAKSLSEAYELLYNTVMNDPTSGYEPTSSSIKHTPIQVQTILGAV